MPYPRSIATCGHPERRVHGLGKCVNCYRKYWREKNPVKNKAATKRNNAARANKPNVTIPICHPEKRYGGKGLCRMCYVKKWRHTFPEKQKRLQETSGKTWHQNNRPRIRETSHRRYNRMTPRQKRMFMVRQRYGLSEKQFNTMLRRQKNRCLICTRKFSWKALCVDHYHRKGLRKGVRGLLCHSCNTWLGKIEKRPHIMKNALRYLKLFGSPLVLNIKFS